jgi:hypothetical protein
MAAEFQQRPGTHPGLLEYFRNRIAHTVTFVRHSYDDARSISLGRRRRNTVFWKWGLLRAELKYVSLTR